MTDHERDLRHLMVDSSENNRGRLPEFAWPGGYAMAYVCDDGEYLCAGCATDYGHLGGDDDGFRIIGFVTADGHDYGEGPWECAHCGREIDADPAEFDADELETIYNGYAAAAIWAGLDWTHCATPDDHGDAPCTHECVEQGNPAPLDRDYDAHDISHAAAEEIREDIAGFVNATENAAALRSAFDGRGWDLEQLGHDFYLTRNGHGTGFWNRGQGHYGDTLSNAAHVYGTSELYPGPDGKLYLSH